jgi:hypothetical protein
MKFPKSKTGWIFVIVYLLVAIFFTYQAFVCSGFACDLVELPAIVPFGVLYLLLLQLLNPIYFFGSIIYAPFQNLFFIIPNILGNMLLYYWIGLGFEKLFRKLATKNK